MKKWIRIALFLWVSLAGAAISAESLDKVWIVPEDTGDPETLVKLDRPNFEPAQNFKLYVEKAKLAAKWNEGYATGICTIYSRTGEKVWTSNKEIFKKQVDGDVWTLSKILDLALPDAVSKGSWRLEIIITDYHTGTNYVGNAAFTVGLEDTPAQTAAETPAPEEKAPAPAKPAKAAPAKSSPSGGFVTVIDNTEFYLLSATRANGKITFKFRVTAQGDDTTTFRIGGSPSRLIDANGKDLKIPGSEVMATFREGPEFVPEIPTLQELSLKVPNSLIDSLAYVEITFDYQPEKIIFKNLQIPYSAE
jgi:hypothetical protein